MYLAVAEFGLGKAALAKALGCSRQNVHQAVAAVEALRENDSGLDALLGGLARLAKGGA